MQAEEILKEALRHNPDRLAIHSKLLDIYVKRRDAASFLASANNAFKLVGAESPEWARICELGLSIDPQNPLYQPGGATASAFVSLDQNVPVTEPGEPGASDEALNSVPVSGTDLDLDLDFSADDAAQTSAFNEAPNATLDGIGADTTVKMDAQETAASNGIDFDIPELDMPEPAPADTTPAELPQELANLSLSLDNLDLDVPEPPVPELPDLPEPVVTAPAKSSDGMLEFDLGSLSLDLGPSSQAGTDDAGSATGDNSLETKLALAEEFVSIGDHDGARALIEEVVVEATGELRDKAQRALANLN
jgi:pilus assembly protein FimV